MCVVSMIGDDWNKRFPDSYPNWPGIKPLDPTPYMPTTSYTISTGVSQEEFEKYKKEHAAEVAALRNDIEALKDMLRAAKIYDEKTGQANCEVEQKIELLKKIAEMVGVNLEDVFKST